MAEENVNYASVVFKNKNFSSPADEKEEETVYAEVKAVNEATELSDGKTVSTDKKGSSQCRRLTCCLGILCVILLSGVVAVVVYVVISHTSEQNQLEENKVSANQNLTDVNNKLRSENENLRRDNNNLTQSFAALENKTSNLTAENQELKGQNQELKGQNQELEGQNQELEGQNQELEMQNNNLTRKIQDLEANWNELNVSRAQWSVDAYCYEKKKQCKPCQKGWRHFQSSCYAINDAKRDEQKSWDGAREDCREKISDLVVIASERERMKVVNDYSWPVKGSEGYWIGLRVKDMKWQWVDGRDLTETSWIDPPTDGHCAMSVRGRGLRSANCSDRNTWICKKTSLVL